VQGRPSALLSAREGLCLGAGADLPNMGALPTNSHAGGGSGGRGQGIEVGKGGGEGLQGPLKALADAAVVRGRRQKQKRLPGEAKEGRGPKGRRQGEGRSAERHPRELEEGAVQGRLRGGEGQERAKGRLPREVRGVEVREVELGHADKARACLHLWAGPHCLEAAGRGTSAEMKAAAMRA
jgi:hypothetical protein